MGDCQSKKKVEISDEIEEIEIDRDRDQGSMDEDQGQIRKGNETPSKAFLIDYRTIND